MGDFELKIMSKYIIASIGRKNRSVNHMILNFMLKINSLTRYKVLLVVHGTMDGKLHSLCKKENIIVRNWPSKRPVSLKDFFFFVRLVLKYNPYCVVASLRPTNLMIIASYFLNVKKRVIWIRSGLKSLNDENEKNVATTFFKNIIFFMSNGILGVSRSIIKDYRLIYNINKKKCFVLHNLIKDPLNSNMLNRNERKNFILSVGRLVPEKGFSTLLKAYSTLINHFNFDFKLLIIGDGPYRDILKNQARELKIWGQCKFIGSVPYEILKDYYKNTLVTILPSECRESFGYVIIESLAFGTPVIASNIGGIKEIIKDEYNGLLFEPGSQIELEESIKKITQDNILWKKIRRNARFNFLSKHNMDSSIDDKVVQFVNWIN